MSRMSRSNGEGLCQLLQCHYRQGPLCHCVLITLSMENTASPWVNCLHSSFFCDGAYYLSPEQLRHFCYNFRKVFAVALKKKKKRLFTCEIVNTFFCVCVQNSDYTTGQVFDLSEKLEQSEAQLGRGSFMLGLDTHDRKSEDKLAKATRDR